MGDKISTEVQKPHRRTVRKFYYSQLNKYPKAQKHRENRQNTYENLQHTHTPVFGRVHTLIFFYINFDDIFCIYCAK